MRLRCSIGDPTLAYGPCPGQIPKGKLHTKDPHVPAKWHTSRHMLPKPGPGMLATWENKARRHLHIPSFPVTASKYTSLTYTKDNLIKIFNTLIFCKDEKQNEKVTTGQNHSTWSEWLVIFTSVLSPWQRSPFTWMPSADSTLTPS